MKPLHSYIMLVNHIIHNDTLVLRATGLYQKEIGGRIKKIPTAFS